MHAGHSVQGDSRLVAWVHGTRFVRYAIRFDSPSPLNPRSFWVIACFLQGIVHASPCSTFVSLFVGSLPCWQYMFVAACISTDSAEAYHCSGLDLENMMRSAPFWKLGLSYRPASCACSHRAHGPEGPNRPHSQHERAPLGSESPCMTIPMQRCKRLHCPGPMHRKFLLCSFVHGGYHIHT